MVTSGFSFFSCLISSLIFCIEGQARRQATVRRVSRRAVGAGRWVSRRAGGARTLQAGRRDGRRSVGADRQPATHLQMAVLFLDIALKVGDAAAELCRLVPAGRLLPAQPNQLLCAGHDLLILVSAWAMLGREPCNGLRALHCRCLVHAGPLDAPIAGPQAPAKGAALVLQLPLQLGYDVARALAASLLHATHVGHLHQHSSQWAGA